MNLSRLHQLLNETTVQLRKGEIVHETPGGGSISIDMMPHADEANPDLQKVDCHFLYVGVDKKIAETSRAEFIEILKSWPEPSVLAGGPSYITVGAEIGDQGAAFQLFALGKTLGLWDIITPATFHLEGGAADHAAGVGYIMITGFDANKY